MYSELPRLKFFSNPTINRPRTIKGNLQKKRPTPYLLRSNRIYYLFYLFRSLVIRTPNYSARRRRAGSDGGGGNARAVWPPHPSVSSAPSVQCQHGSKTAPSQWRATT